jgi:hypothetical protein
MIDPDGNPELPDRLQREVSPVPAPRLSDRGDINRSYSADLIAASGQLRNPFRHNGSLWVCTSITGRGLTESRKTEHEAYRLMPPALFVGVPTTYRARTGEADAADAARRDPFGFYHGMAVKHGSEAFVMSGPPVRFIAASDPSRPEPDNPEPMQLTLF